MNYRRSLRKRIFLGMFKDIFRNFSVTTWLIIINVFLFIVFSFSLIFSEQWFNIPYQQFFENFIALKPSNILEGRSVWTFITSVFMHGGLGHLFINMFVLFSLGSVMEKIIGSKRFLWFYLISGVFAGLTFVVLAGLAHFIGMGETGALIFGGINIPAVGASGAIFAIAGLFVIILPKSRFAIIFFPFFSFPGYILIPLALFGVWGLTIWLGLPIGNSAHFGGFLAGIVYGIYLRKKFPRKIKRIQGMFSY